MKGSRLLARIAQTTRRYLLLGVALTLAAGSGTLAAVALGTGSADPARTVTVNVGTGEQGPQGQPGPPGPKGEPGSFTCPQGFSEGYLVIDHPGGHVTLFTCLQD